MILNTHVLCLFLLGFHASCATFHNYTQSSLRNDLLAHSFPCQKTEERLGSRCPPILFPIQLWYDLPAVVALLKSVNGNHSHAMHFESVASRKPAVIFMDCEADAYGTANGFIFKAFVTTSGVSIQPSHTASVCLVDGQPHPLLGQVSISITMGPTRDTLRLLVMKENAASANIILGSDYLKHLKARMCWDTNTLSHSPYCAAIHVHARAL